MNFYCALNLNYFLGFAQRKHGLHESATFIASDKRLHHDKRFLHFRICFQPMLPKHEPHESPRFKPTEVRLDHCHCFDLPLSTQLIDNAISFLLPELGLHPNYELECLRVKVNAFLIHICPADFFELLSFKLTRSLKCETFVFARNEGVNELFANLQNSLFLFFEGHYFVHDLSISELSEHPLNFGSSVVPFVYHI